MAENFPNYPPSGEHADNSYSSQKPIPDTVGPAGTVNTHIPLLTLRSVIMGAFVSMGGFLFGYDTGQISGFQDMSNYLERYGQVDSHGTWMFSNVRAGLIVGLLSIGTLIGALVAAPIADRIGRKWSISIWSAILIVGVIVQITSPNRHWWQMVVGRWVTGLGVGGCSLVVPMYQGESAPRQVRGALICCYQLFITMGIFVAYLINLGTNHLDGTAQWRITLGLTIVFALFLGGGIAFFPETPRYQYRMGQIDSARATMAKFYGVPENHVQILEELEEIQDQIAKETEEQSWHEIFTAPAMGYRIILGMVLQALQQLTGANYYFYFGTTIFQGAGIDNSFVTQCILGAVNFGCTFGGLYAIENFGRRKSLITGGILMFIFFIIFATVGHFSLDYNHPKNTPNSGKGMIVVACLFIASYAITWGPMIWALIAEIYPMKYRARGMALATASNWLWNFLIGFFTPFIRSAIDFRYGYVFAGCLFLAVLVVYFCVIETKGRTLEEIDFMYANKVLAWKSSKYELPPANVRGHTEEFGHEESYEDKGAHHAEQA